MKVLLTGAAGFIGSHLAEALIKDHQVIGIDNFCDFYDPQIKHKNIENLLKNQNFKLIEADIRHQKVLSQIFSENGIDLIIHLAAMAGVRPSIENPQLYTEVNINGTVNLLEECRKHNIKKFIFASSSSVYGNNKKVPFAESDPVDFPISPYAATKKAGELICHTYHHLHRISMVCLRFFTVYGPRQRPDLAIRKFTTKILNGEEIPVFGDGNTRRDYTFINDIIHGIMQSVKFVESGLHYEIFNLGESHTISLNEMIATIENELQIEAKRKILPMQPGDVQQTYADISKSKKILDYHPQTDFTAGIKIFIDWLKQQ
ncbi:MAG TPA: GDP-mannose 4,6-dehydratase [Candidatus Cloacimonadota bacterium]|nr:GDP-mannose 4,6-dehydratase [Candidatus Cloacimonadota bacterium]